MSIEKKEVLIDWFQFTVPYSVENENSCFDLINQYSPLKPATPLHGYAYAQKNQYGAMCFVNRKRPEMGVHVQMPGQQCQIMRELGEEFPALAKEIVAAGGKGSRIDVTNDFSGVTLRPMGIMNLFEKKERTGTTRSASIIYELEGGQTIYLGSWKSDRFARIYEKTRRFGDLDEQVLRLELVSKQRYAHATLEQLATNGVADVASSALATLDKMAGLNNEDWMEMMKDKTQPLAIGRKATADDDSWLLNIVASAVAKRLAAQDGSKFWTKFIDTVKRKAIAYGVTFGDENE